MGTSRGSRLLPSLAQLTASSHTSRAKADVEGLHFSALKFSGGGRHLAVLAAPTSAPRLTQVCLCTRYGEV